MNKVGEKNVTKELINNFKIYLYEEERSDNTIEKYMRDIRFFREWLQGRSIDKSLVIEYKKELCKRYAEESEIKCLKCINELLDEFVENNLHLWFDENYVANLKKKAGEIM